MSDSVPNPDGTRVFIATNTPGVRNPFSVPVDESQLQHNRPVAIVTDPIPHREHSASNRCLTATVSLARGTRARNAIAYSVRRWCCFPSRGRRGVSSSRSIEAARHRGPGHAAKPVKFPIAGPGGRGRWYLRSTARWPEGPPSGIAHLAGCSRAHTTRARALELWHALPPPRGENRYGTALAVLRQEATDSMERDTR